MPTEKQIQASRTNGARSLGPTTPQGKKNSSRNALRHGLLAGTVVLEEESRPRFRALLAALVEEYQPSTQTESMLVETMATARWRQLRVWGIQKTALDRDMALQSAAVGPPVVRALFALGNSSSACPPELLLRYDIAFDRQFTRALSHLRALKLKPTPTAPAPYVPEFPSGQTFQPQRVRRAPPAEAADPDCAALRFARRNEKVQKARPEPSQAADPADPPKPTRPAPRLARTNKDAPASPAPSPPNSSPKAATPIRPQQVIDSPAQKPKNRPKKTPKTAQIKRDDRPASAAHLTADRTQPSPARIPPLPD